MAGRSLTLFCPGCGRLKGCSAWELECRVTDKALTFVQIGERMRCYRCGNLGCTITYSRNLLEQMTDYIALREHQQALEDARAKRVFDEESEHLFASYRAAGWL